MKGYERQDNDAPSYGLANYPVIMRKLFIDKVIWVICCFVEQLGIGANNSYEVIMILMQCFSKTCRKKAEAGRI